MATIKSRIYVPGHIVYSLCGLPTVSLWTFRYARYSMTHFKTRRMESKNLYLLPLSPLKVYVVRDDSLSGPVVDGVAQTYLSSSIPPGLLYPGWLSPWFTFRELLRREAFSCSADQAATGLPRSGPMTPQRRHFALNPEFVWITTSVVGLWSQAAGETAAFPSFGSIIDVYRR